MGNTTKLKRGTVLTVTRDLSFHLSAHGSVQVAAGTQVTVTRDHGEGNANVQGVVTKRYSRESVTARFMLRLNDAR